MIKVKIGDVWHTAEVGSPIAVALGKEDLENIVSEVNRSGTADQFLVSVHDDDPLMGDTAQIGQWLEEGLDKGVEIDKDTARRIDRTN